MAGEPLTHPAAADFRAVVARAFPESLAEDARAYADIVPAVSLRPAREFAVRIGNETLRLPYRIHNDEPGPGALEGLSPRAQVMAGCMYTRHHDGHLRQRHLERIISAPYPWVVPYVVQLAGEYVAEIIDVIDAALEELATPGSPQHTAYGRFATQNPEFIALAKAHAASYWNEYYRRQYRSLASYPATRFLVRLKRAGRDHADYGLCAHVVGRAEPMAGFH